MSILDAIMSIAVDKGGESMPTDNNAKSNRVLELYRMLLLGKVLKKQELAEHFRVNSKSIQRDIESIRNFLADQTAQQGVLQSIEYDIKEKGYRLITQEITHLTEGEMLAVCKILLESRTFSKEAVTSLLNRILNLAVSPKSKKQIEGYIANEVFNYSEPVHPSINTDILWTISNAINDFKYIEIEYSRLKGKEVVKRKVQPVGVVFSEFYFYLLGIIEDKEKRLTFQKKNDPFPTIYRIDRIQNINVLDEKFSVKYADRFQEGQYKNRVQFMFGGEVQQIEFKYYGPSIEAVLDKLPMAEIVEESDGFYTVKAETFGKGILMWLLSQGSKIRVIAPADLKTEWLTEVKQILNRERE